MCIRDRDRTKFSVYSVVDCGELSCVVDGDVVIAGDADMTRRQDNSGMNRACRKRENA